MSPLWRDEVVIHLTPRRLTLSRRARGIHPRVVAASDVAIPSGGGVELGPVVARLADVLADPTWHGASARVLVADHPWVRYAIVPWPEERLDEAGRLAHARYVLGDAYGGAVAEWTVALADTPPGRAYVACAMPASLRAALEDVLASARLALASLQPRLVASFNAWRHRVPAADAWFVCVDEGSLAAAHVAQGAWDRVHVTRPSSAWTVELDRLVAFDRATRNDGAPGRMLVDAPVWMRPVGGTGAGFEWLDASDGHEASALAMPGRSGP